MARDFSEKADRMDVRYVAALARIPLTDGEAAELQSQLDGILAYVGELKSLDVDGVVQKLLTTDYVREALRESGIRV